MQRAVRSLARSGGRCRSRAAPARRRARGSAGRRCLSWPRRWRCGRRGGSPYIGMHHIGQLKILCALTERTGEGLAPVSSPVALGLPGRGQGLDTLVDNPDGHDRAMTLLVRRRQSAAFRPARAGGGLLESLRQRVSLRRQSRDREQPVHPGHREYPAVLHGCPNVQRVAGEPALPPAADDLAGHRLPAGRRTPSGCVPRHQLRALRPAVCGDAVAVSRAAESRAAGSRQSLGGALRRRVVRDARGQRRDGELPGPTRRRSCPRWPRS